MHNLYRINNLETEPPLHHCIDQTTEATNSKFGSDVLHKINMKMGILKDSDYTGAKFYNQMPFVSSSELCSRI